MIKRLLLFASIVCLPAILGCYRQVTLHSTAVEVEELSERGEWYVVEEVGHGDEFRAVASFVWPKAGRAGIHKFYWEIYQNGHLILRDKKARISFTSSPFLVWYIIDSSSLKPGKCEFVLYLDGEERCRIETNIVERKRN